MPLGFNQLLSEINDKVFLASKARPTRKAATSLYVSRLSRKCDILDILQPVGLYDLL